MNVIVVDDERIVLTAEAMTIQRALPNANIYSFQNSKDAIQFAESNKVDIAFLDINMKSISDLLLAEKLHTNNPNVHIIFCTGYSEYTQDLYYGAFLMKPLTYEKVQMALDTLKYPIE